MKLIAYNYQTNTVFEMFIDEQNKDFVQSLLKHVHVYASLMFEYDISIDEAVNKIFNSDKITIGGNVMFVNDDDIDVESEMTQVIGLQNRASLNYSTLNINNPNSFDMFVQCL